MKNNLRTISYTIFHIMIALACGDSLSEDRYIALSIAGVCFLIFIFTRPTFKEWQTSCMKRNFFYITGGILFIIIGFSESVNNIADWQDVNTFVIYFKIMGAWLILKWIYSSYIRNKYKYNGKLIDDIRDSFMSNLK